MLTEWVVREVEFSYSAVTLREVDEENDQNTYNGTEYKQVLTHSLS